jgi:hypothetical protein
MIYTVENKKTHKQYDVSTLDGLDMRKKYTLVSEWDEKAKIKAPIPEEIIVKSTKKTIKEQPEKQTQEDND